MHHIKTARLTALASAALLATGANAFEIDTGDSGFKVRAANTTCAESAGR